MKKVLVAIDFSKTSLNALEYGIGLAQKGGADLLMVWVDNCTTDDAMFDSFPNETRKEKVEQFKELISEHEGKLKGKKMGYKTKRGKVYIEIANVAKSADADIIITGTHGVSGFEEFWIGSNAYRIVTHAPCPVITLRHDVKSGNIKSIVLPIDSSPETRQKVPFTAELASLYGSKVYILSLYSTGLKSVQKRVDNYAQQVKKYFEENNISCENDARESDNITQTTIDYAQEKSADLISIMTEQETTTANLFLGPYAQQMVNNSPIPIMSVRSKELTRIPVK
jgi:nucleotide-binding universal stress UspA family protein